MKNLILVLFVTIASSSYGQKKIDLLKLTMPKFSATDSIKIDEKNKIINLYGNVNFETEKLRITANQVFLDQKTNKLLATGLKDYSFTDKVNIAKNSKNTVLKYTIGEDTIFIE